MSDAVKIGSALAGGYLLGRTKKAKAAIGLAMWLTGRGRPSDWLRQGVINLAQSPEGARLIKQARGPLLDSARGAATSTVNAQLGSLADDLNRRTGLLTGKAEPIESEPEEEPEAEEPEAEEPEAGSDEEPERPRTTTSAKRSSTRKRPAKNATAKKSTAKKSSTKKAPAKKASAKKSPARKSTSGRSRSGSGASTRKRQTSSRRPGR